jgi:hypothetical protein
MAHYQHANLLLGPEPEVPQDEDSTENTEKNTNFLTSNTNTTTTTNGVYVRYSSLRTDLSGTVLSTLRQLDYPPALLDRLQMSKLLVSEQVKSKSYQSEHVHSAQICCKVSNDELKHEFFEVYKSNRF